MFLSRKGILTFITAFALTLTLLFPISTSYSISFKDAYDLYEQITSGKFRASKSTTSKPTTTTNQGSNQSAKQTSNQTLTPSQLELAERIINTGKKYLGTPYKYGAPAGQTKYFDCSLFVQTVFKENGIKLPRSSRQQYQVGTPVSRNHLQKGDLLFFTTSTSGGKIGHVGIYAGNNTILHTWGPGGVKFESLNKSWLQKGYVGAKRVF